MKDHTLMMLE